jgi:hypothetical protein
MCSSNNVFHRNDAGSPFTPLNRAPRWGGSVEPVQGVDSRKWSEPLDIGQFCGQLIRMPKGGRKFEDNTNTGWLE